MNFCVHFSSWRKGNETSFLLLLFFFLLLHPSCVQSLSDIEASSLVSELSRARLRSFGGAFLLVNGFSHRSTSSWNLLLSLTKRLYWLVLSVSLATMTFSTLLVFVLNTISKEGISRHVTTHPFAAVTPCRTFLMFSSANMTVEFQQEAGECSSKGGYIYIAKLWLEGIIIIIKEVKWEKDILMYIYIYFF